MSYINNKKALIAICDGEIVKMISNDFKDHVFYRNKRAGKSIVHQINRNAGRPLYLYLSNDEFKNKFADCEFAVMEDNII